MPLRLAIVSAVTALLLASSASAAESPQKSPAPSNDGVHLDLLDNTLSVEGDIDEDEIPATTLATPQPTLSPWFAFKQRFEQRTGISFGGSYGILAQGYTSSLINEDQAVGHKFTFNASVALINRDQPDAVHFDIAIEDRRPLFTNFAPLQAGFLAGSGLPTAATWGNFSLGVTQAYIRQTFAGGRFQYAIGKIFAPNFVDPYPFFDDNRQFLSLAFSTSPTIASPLRGAGFVVAAYPGPGSLYIKSGMFTANSSDTGLTIDDFFGRAEHFYFVEVGSTSFAQQPIPIQGRGAMDRNNIHITIWYRDPLDPRGPHDITRPQPKAYGAAFNINQMAGDSIMWFVRGGLGKGGLAKANLSAGLGYRPRSRTGDLLGFGIGWSKPDDTQLPIPIPHLRDQFTSELFYRLAVTPNLAITPVAQFMLHPSLNASKNSLATLSLRTRLAF